MTVQRVFGVVTAGLLTCGAGAVAGASAQTHEATVLPAQGGMITLVGCFQRGGKHDKYILTSPTIGPSQGVTETKCSSTGRDQMVELKDTHYGDLSVPMLGHMVEITGRLEKIEGRDDPDDLRELHVRSFRLVPVLPPRVAEAAPAPEPAPRAVEPQPAPKEAEVVVLEEQPVGTTGVLIEEELPRTASPLPLVGTFGLLSLATCFALRLFARRRAEACE